MKLLLWQLPHQCCRQLLLCTLLITAAGAANAQATLPFPDESVPAKAAHRQTGSLPAKSNFFDWTTTGWEHQTSSVITYDARGNAINTIVTNAVTNQPEEQVQQTFDARNNQTLLLVQSWTNNQWQNNRGYRNFITYNTNGKITEHIRQEWQNAHWVNVAKQEMSYNTAGLETEKVSSIWHNGTWQFATRHQSSYQNGMLSDFTIQKFTNNIWENENRFFGYTYQTGANSVLGYIRQTWKNNGWADELRFSFTYPANNTTIRLTEQLQNGIWVNSTRVTTGYNVQGDVYTYQLDEWQNNAWQKRSESQTSSYFNTQNQLISQLTKRYNTSTNQLENYQLYTYADFVVISGLKPQPALLQAAVYPNPFRNIVSVSLTENNAEPVTLQISDISGKLLKAQMVPPGLQQICLNTETLPTGIYILHLHTTDKQQTFKLIKQ